MQTLITGGTIVNEGRIFAGDILIENENIQVISEKKIEEQDGINIIDATGCYILPGIIDTHVHFREPGLTHKADIDTESRAAAFGGVTSYFDMPNCNPQTTTLEALAQKQEIARQHSHVNYAFFFGATNSNAHLFKELDHATIPGIKLFMGSSTGNMLVDQDEALHNVFTEAQRNDLIVMAHCEDTETINANAKEIESRYGKDADVSLHPQIRSRQACIKSSEKAVELAKETGARLHIAHVSTKEELALAREGVTLEACVPHIIFAESDYTTLGTRIKCNPAVKTAADREAIIQGLNNGTITTIATDHAPHTWTEKQGGALTATSGMPMLQFSLISMLETNEDLTKIAELMSHNPARLFKIRKRGFLRQGYKADIAIIRRQETPWQLSQQHIQSKCGWSPLEGRTFHWSVCHTICNGHHILDNGTFHPTPLGQQIEFQ